MPERSEEPKLVDPAAVTLFTVSRVRGGYLVGPGNMDLPVFAIFDAEPEKGYYFIPARDDTPPEEDLD